MAYTLRLILGICLVVSICQLIQCTDTEQIEQTTASIKENFLENNETNNQTINEETTPKTEQITLSTINDNNKTIKNDNNTERINSGRAIDIKKYVSKEFHDRNNVYTLPLSTDTEKFLNYNHDFETTTYKLDDFSKDFNFDTQLTTPMSRIFDKNYKETVDSVDQTLEHIDNYSSKENDNIDDNNNNTSMDYQNFRNIIKNNTNNNNKSMHNDLIIEEGKKLNYISNYNETKIVDDDKPPKNNSENMKIIKNQYETTTTRKNLVLTKPPIRNNSHISILSNRIETETLKAIDPIITTTETIKINEQSVQENQIIPIQIKAPSTTENIENTTNETEIGERKTLDDTNTSTIAENTENTTIETEIAERKTLDDKNSTTIAENMESTTIETGFTTEITETKPPLIDTTTTTENMESTVDIGLTTEIPESVENETTTEILTITTTEITEISTETTINEDTTVLTTETNWNSSNDPITTEIINETTEIDTTTENFDKSTINTETTINQIINRTDNKTDEITEISTESITTELPATFLKTETVRTTESLLVITANPPETTEINRIPKHDDIFNRFTTEIDEFTTIIDNPNFPTSDSSEIIADHPDGDGGDNGKIIAIIISSVGAICLIILAGLLFIMRKRQKRFNYGQRCRPVSLDDYSMDNISVYNSVRRKGIDRSSKRSYGNPAFEDPASISHPLNFPALGKFANNFDDMKAEFEEIPQITAKTNELPDGCDTKNRYANVIPLPETRVFLNPRENCANSDYINANYVTGPKNIKGYYIACQAPMQNTVDDFWRMIWEQQCKVILMLTHLYENGVEKCFDYLPPSEVLDCHRLFGDYQVTLKKREVKDKYIISILQLKNMVSNSWREITHFWYLGWPEKGVPSEANSLIAFLIEARSYMKTSTLDRKDNSNGLSNGNLNETNPVVVHCSPGTGRTGVVIACDIAIREFEQNRLVDIPRIVYRIRRDRANAVQTKEQYMFIYKVISLYATKLTGGALDSL